MTKKNISQIVAAAHSAMARKDPKLRKFFNNTAQSLFQSQFRNRVRTAHAMTYMKGLAFAESKTAEGIAREQNVAEHALRRLLHDAPWDAQDTLLAAARLAIAAAAKQGVKLVAYITDDTCQTKWGDKSPGVANQWNNKEHRRENCQCYVTLSLAFTNGHSIPIGARPYLPTGSWDEKRCEAAGMPASMAGKTKHTLALEMLDAALAAGLPTLPVLADCPYGRSAAFREALTTRSLAYLLDVDHDTAFYDAAAPATTRKGASKSRRIGTSKQANAWLKNKPWKHGSGGRTHRHKLLRPRCHRTGYLYMQHEPAALHLIEEKRKTKKKDRVRYSVTDLPINDALTLLGTRWHIERNYRELKHLVGLTKYQGRSYQGLTRHLALACIAHIILFWTILYNTTITLYEARRLWPKSLTLTHQHTCPTCEQPLSSYD